MTAIACTRRVAALTLAGLIGACAPAPSDAPPSTAPVPQQAPVVKAAEAATTAASDRPEVEDRGDELVIPGLVGWWNNPDVLALLALSDAQNTELTDQLRNMELSYQLAQSQLKTARHQQASMLEDPSVASATIEAFHREQLQTQSAVMLDLNIKARLLAREKLTAAQLAILLQRSPGFFRARWFRPARVQMRQGTVPGAKS
jgi:hypothetical protein